MMAIWLDATPFQKAALVLCIRTGNCKAAFPDHDAFGIYDEPRPRWKRKESCGPETDKAGGNDYKKPQLPQMPNAWHQVQACPVVELRGAPYY